MDYRKIILYLIIILAAFGYWYKLKHDEKKAADEVIKFADVYAATSVMADLYRNEPGKFMQARDSIFKVYDYNEDSVRAFKDIYEGKEEQWTLVWNVIRTKTDSLIAYFKTHPVEHTPDSLINTADSTSSK